jgi:hypothetical protein
MGGFMNCRALSVFLLAFFLSAPVLAEEPKPDDIISLDLSAEDWVVTKTAHVTLDVEAAVNASGAGPIRADMTKAVNDAAKADWRLTSFNRAQDQTGMERWSVVFDARLPEAALNGLTESVKKASKAGMQIRVGSIDFIPSREEMEAARAVLRGRIFKDAADQLAALNTALPGRNYRISQITFETDIAVPVRMFRGKSMTDNVALNAIPMGAVASSVAIPEQAQDVSQKLVLNAHVVLAALPPVSAPAH